MDGWELTHKTIYFRNFVAVAHKNNNLMICTGICMHLSRGVFETLEQNGVVPAV